MQLPEQSSAPDGAEEGLRTLQSFRFSKLIVPVLLGLAAVGYLFYRQFDIQRFRDIAWSGRAFAWIGLSFVLLIVRHLFYAFRLRSITNHFFSWKKAIEMIIFWEFSSTVTPTSKGGPVVMLFVLSKEGLPSGRTAAAVFYAMLNDVSFFVLLMPVMLAVYGPIVLYPGMQTYRDVGLASGTFFATFSVMVVYWLFLLFFILVRPGVARSAMEWLAGRKLLRKWAPKLQQMGHDFTQAAVEIRRQDWRFHLRGITGTVGAWTCKFLMINCLIIAIVPTIPVDGATQAFIYARLIAMFIIMAFSPTPGGAGLAEIALAGFISDFVPSGIGLVVALLWRGMAYYGYLLLGALLVPAWVQRNWSK